MSVGVGGNISNSTLTAGTSSVKFEVTGNVVNSRFIADFDISGDVGGSVSRSEFTSQSAAVSLAVAGTMTSSLVDAYRNVSADMGGTVQKSSSLVTGGNAMVNVGVFDASPGDITVTILGGGAGKSARFYVGRFETDTIVFQGNFQGNVRVLHDLVADLQFTGDVSRITIGGQVLADITVGGSLFYLNSNSWFQRTGSGKRTGTFVNSRFANTGTLTTGSYVTVVPVVPPVG